MRKVLKIHVGSSFGEAQVHSWVFACAQSRARGSTGRVAARVKPMVDTTRTIRFRFWRSPVRLIGVIAPRRSRARFRQEWATGLVK
jgi:hypothetical protein